MVVVRHKAAEVVVRHKAAEVVVRHKAAEVVVRHKAAVVVVRHKAAVGLDKGRLCTRLQEKTIIHSPHALQDIVHTSFILCSLLASLHVYIAHLRSTYAKLREHFLTLSASVWSTWLAS